MRLRSIVVACVVVGLTIRGVAVAAADSRQGSGDWGELLVKANADAQQGDWQSVYQRAASVLASSPNKVDQAEAHRLLGLAAFFTGKLDVAENEFVAYLKLDLDGRLDPAVVAPEAITYFESVRVQHAAELRALRPRTKRSWALNLLPPLGQFQNQQPIKGIVIGSALGLFVAGNVASYFLLRSWCGSSSRVCDDTGVDHTGAARQLRSINILSGVAAISLYLYGVVDGSRGYRVRTAQLQFAITADQHATGFAVSGRF
jgi:hypothetical protein